ncbi:response regulator transcription factor [Actinoplanes sp. KI2]|uniref:response regulator transcription factor n=1 Tax=Actinoplanes sp. KI2 TaxID=2983315 RepID=UPI0021D5B28F|nr:response regulator transcription factor [Actinoplanes sp. KI2]MCU7727470.1 response regulator transcription factor [Actinoplanes sp. KI2]
MIVSNHALIREALCLILSLDGLEVSGASGSEQEVLVAARAANTEVAVVDLDPPGRHGLRTVRLLVKELPAIATVALSAQQTPGVLRGALAAGARGFASRDDAPNELAETVRRVARGDLVIHPATAMAALAAIENPLSAREREVLRLAGQGLPCREIAARLFLSKGTVRNYLSDAIRKMECTNRLQAARRAEEEGWL